MLHLSIDLSLTKTGWAVIEVTDRLPSVIDCGIIRTDAKESDGERLRTIVNAMHAILRKYPDIDSVSREAGIVKFPKPTMQVFKAHGSFEYSVADYEVNDIPLATVKAWARRLTKSAGKRNDKEMIAEGIVV
ncbi:MAG: crossover junction endodeoxyribonuclease RuvC, partial [Actinobacteria bacterium]|nr:crossover junction endodeoxyribonuclease RuvC [Actinomycetota bacterium]